MKTKKKKFIFAVIIIMSLIAIIVLGYLYFNFSKKEKKLKTGIYSLNTYGALYYDIQEDISFDLLMYFYNSENENDYELLRRYSDFKLITKNGPDINFTIDDSIDGFVKADDNRIFQNNIKIDIDKSCLSDNELHITGLSYMDENNNIVNVSLGNILIKKVDEAKITAEVVATKFEWKRYMLPLMYTYDIEVENIGENNITIKEIDFGLEEISSDFIDMEIKPKEIVQYNCEVDFINIEGDCIFYLKPIIQIDSNDESGYVIQKNICRHRYISNSISLYDYFLGGGADD